MRGARRARPQIGYDSKKLPLGKLAPSTIQHGQRLLQAIADVIAGKAAGDLRDLSDEFYTVIPHDFGFRKAPAPARPPARPPRGARLSVGVRGRAGCVGRWLGGGMGG